MENEQPTEEVTERTTQHQHNIWLWLLMGLIAVGGLFAWTWYALGNDADANINSYEECVAAGYPVAESYPEQCTVPGGPSFTRELSQEEQDRLNDEAENQSHRYQSEKGVEIVVDSPESGESISSPVAITGQVPGNWSFEASFPIELRDGEGNLVAEGHGELQGDWMTQELVPFTAELEFENVSGQGSVILLKDNPSGLAENEDSVTIPIVFK